MFLQVPKNKIQAMYCFVGAIVIFIIYRVLPFEMPPIIDLFAAPLWAVLLAYGMYLLIKKDKPHDPTNV